MFSRTDLQVAVCYEVKDKISEAPAYASTPDMEMLQLLLVHVLQYLSHMQSWLDLSHLLHSTS